MSFPNRATLEAEQLAQLNTLLTALVPSNVFYAPKLESAGLGEGVGSLAEFYATLPLTTKQHIVDWTAQVARGAPGVKVFHRFGILNHDARLFIGVNQFWMFGYLTVQS